MQATTLQQIRACRPEPCWPCFRTEFLGMYRRLRRAQDQSINAPFPHEWVMTDCDWRTETLQIKCNHCSDHLKECTRIPGLLEGNLRDLTNTIDYFRGIIDMRGGSPIGYSLSDTARVNLMRSLVKLAVGFDHVVNCHKEEHTIRAGTQQALEPHPEEYQLKVRQRRHDLSIGALQRHPYPDDGLIRLTRDDREFYAWSSRVYKFYDDVASGLEVGRTPEEVIVMIIADIPIEQSMIRGDDHTKDQGGSADSGFRDGDHVTAPPEPPTKEEPASLPAPDDDDDDAAVWEKWLEAGMKSMPVHAPRHPDGRLNVEEMRAIAGVSSTFRCSHCISKNRDCPSRECYDHRCAIWVRFYNPLRQPLLNGNSDGFAPQEPKTEDDLMCEIAAAKVKEMTATKETTAAQEDKPKDFTDGHRFEDDDLFAF
ncbi:hypothetical protein CEP54_000306 [Fusarium duplospermum]|uniref:Uncharacterized protein n=1 Tax=Fusarium duplospermum TaxID=1325734 RepID=A0A428R6P1_9HYPO|nr:hypothetical protein CEP54_000306 [Fusarium duplospermum]